MMAMTTMIVVAQSFGVKGVVLDAAGEPVIGASILVKGSVKGTKTDVDGSFMLNGIKEKDKLVVSYVGMKTQTLNAKASMKIVMENEDNMLDEVMVVAFGEQKKSSFTGPANVIDSKKLEQRQVTNVRSTLQGNVAGLQSFTTSGAPDASPEFRIRGISSINAGNKPLIVLDGAPYDGEWNSISPTDVASVTVLKDAASNALYGARGANGVIIVTTKKGTKGKATITLDMKVGANSRASKRYNTIDNPAQYVETHYSALYNYYKNNGQSNAEAWASANNTLWKSKENGGLGYLPYTVPEGQYLIGDNGKLNPAATLGRKVTNQGNTYTLIPDDWIDETYRTGVRQEYNLSLSGGGESGEYFASLGYMNNEGIALCSDYERYTTRLKSTYKAAPWLNVGGNINFARSTSNHGADVNDTEDDNANNIYTQISLIAPIYPVYLRDGNGNLLMEHGRVVGDYGDGQLLGSDYIRPYLSQLNGVTEASLNTNKKTITSFSLNGFADIDIISGLKATVNGSIYFSNSYYTITQNPFYGYGYQVFPGGYTYKRSVNDYTYNFQQLLKYTKSWGNHNMSLMAGHESYKYNQDYLEGWRKDMYSYFENQELSSAVTTGNTTSYYTGYNTEGWLFRGLYDYDGKYFGQVSFRRDASSRFHPDHRWGNFYSFGGAWIITKEPWMKDITWLDMLKLKASFGQNGNDNISDYLYTDTYSIDKGEGSSIGLTLANIGNENITWETVTNVNVGAEFEMFKGRLRGGLEYFYRKTTDMLCKVRVPLSMGYTSYYSNVGDMVNKGIELELEGDPIVTKDLKWTVGMNLTSYKNEVLSLNSSNKYSNLEGHEGYSSGNYFYGEGLPIYTWRLIKYAGLNENGESTWYIHDKEGNLTTTTTPTEITEDEDFYDCGTALPDFYGGFSTSVQAFGFDLSIAFAYSVGGKVMDWGYQSLMKSPTSESTGEAMHQDLLNAWSTSNTGSDIPRLQYGDQYSNYTSDRFLIDGSWLSLQNITLGYTLPKKWVNTLGLSNVRLTVSGENLTYWSKRKGLDPRIAINGSIENTKYAASRTILGGISVQF